ncbi:MAG: methenyltetrahydromethanopterin cyclohydrolase [Candidatus Thorarchaeota archaeon]
MDISINKNALDIVSEILDRKERLQCEVSTLPCGATVLDAGVLAKGCTELGCLVGEVSMGGLGAVRLSTMYIGDLSLPAVVVATDEPVIATLGSQHTGWAIKVGKYSAMGSGPARALARVEKQLYEEIQYNDNHTAGVMVLESRDLPTDEVAEHVAEKCGLSSSDMTFVVVPTASEAGSAQISARIVEVGIHKMHEIGFDLTRIRRGYGVAPIAPVAKSDARAMGATNDCIRYGGRTFYFLREGAEGVAEIIQQIPTRASEQNGQSFYDLFKSADSDIYRLDPCIFSPAEITISHIESRSVYKAGELDPIALKRSLGL